jgi:hypothetical protein
LQLRAGGVSEASHLKYKKKFDEKKKLEFKTICHLRVRCC